MARVVLQSWVMPPSPNGRATEVQPTGAEPGRPLVSEDPQDAAKDIQPRRHPWAPAGILLAVLVATLAVIIVAVVL